MEQSHIDLSDIRLDKGKRKLFRLSHTFKPAPHIPTSTPQSQAHIASPHIPSAIELQSAHNPHNAYSQAISHDFIQTTNTQNMPQNESSAVVKHDLSFKDLRNAFFIVFGILALALPKIFLSTQIYYASKEVARLQTQHDILSDENRRLKHRLEGFRYQFVIKKD